MDFRIRRLGGALEKIEVAALVRLAHVLGEQRAYPRS